MQMKISSLKTLTTGTGKAGPWTLVEARFEGQGGVYKGFVGATPPQVGETVDAELSQEEYKGNLEDRFKLNTKRQSASGVAEMAIKTEVARYGQEILRKLDLVMQKLEVKDFKAEVEAERNKPAMTPTWEQPEITPDDIPF